jgi:thiosulfate sulfurtransferase
MAEFVRLSVNDAANLMREREVLVLDIRDADSYAAGHIQGAHLLNPEIAAHISNNADLESPIVVCCYHGNSSQQAAAWFAEEGFEEVYSLNGGYEEWATSGHDAAGRLPVPD